MLLPSTSFWSRCRLVDEPHEMAAQFVADALIMAMPPKWRRVCTLAFLRRKRCTRPLLLVFFSLANAIVVPNNCGYLHIQLLDFRSRRLTELAHA